MNLNGSRKSFFGLTIRWNGPGMRGDLIAKLYDVIVV